MHENMLNQGNNSIFNSPIRCVSVNYVNQEWVNSLLTLAIHKISLTNDVSGKVNLFEQQKYAYS